MKGVLFVDDEENILHGLRRMLRDLRKEWDMHFVTSGAAGLELMSEKPFDVVVSDMRMPGMDGAEFLGQVRAKYPDAIRIVLSGHSEKEPLMRSLGATHQYLAKPCDPALLRATIERACALRDMMNSRVLREFATSLDSIPSVPALYERIMETLRSSDASVQDVGRLIEQDIGMSAQILKLVNSSYFGVSKHIENVPHAVALLGLETVTSLVLGLHVLGGNSGKAGDPAVMQEIREHSLQAVACARVIAAEDFDIAMRGHALLAAMLHHVGDLLLAVNQPDGCARVRRMREEEHLAKSAAEQIVFGCTQAMLGAYVMGIWGMPAPIVEAIAFVRQPRSAPGHERSALTVLHVADAMAAEIGTRHPQCAGVDLDYLRSLGLENRVRSWTDGCRRAIDGHASVPA
jgi:HD-like signal output (HDOD) protein